MNLIYIIKYTGQLPPGYLKDSGSKSLNIMDFSCQHSNVSNEDFYPDR